MTGKDFSTNLLQCRLWKSIRLKVMRSISNIWCISHVMYGSARAALLTYESIVNQLMNQSPNKNMSTPP